MGCCGENTGTENTRLSRANLYEVSQNPVDRGFDKQQGIES